MTDDSETLEAQTQELANRLWRAVQEYHPSLGEKAQDWLMGQMVHDTILKSLLVRFIDILSALDFDQDGRQVTQLFREYMGGSFPNSGRLLRSILFCYRQPLLPSRLLARSMRAAARELAGRFIAGKDESSILDILSYLQGQSRYPTFALLGEDVLSEDEAEVFKDRYLKLIERLASQPWAGRRTMTGLPALQLSLKLSSLTDNFNTADPEGTLGRVKGRLEAIAQRCASSGIGLTIDAELFEHRELTWHIFRNVFGAGSKLAAWDGIGLTVQSYFTDSEEYLKTVINAAQTRGTPFQIRLAKGAYWDYEVVTARNQGWTVPVFQQKQETDLAFRRMAGVLLEQTGIVTIGLASHNIWDHSYAEALCRLRGLPAGTVEHQTLFRTAENISRAIRRLGWESRDYVPSGEIVPGMAYLIRRIMENTSPLGFLWQSRSKNRGKNLSPATVGPEVPDPTQAPSAVTDVFRNHPPKRLFLEQERAPFESALRKTESEWGQEYFIRLDGQTTRTRDVKASLSPSHPDAKHPVGLAHMGGIQEAERAIETARRGFKRWAAVPVEERALILQKAAAQLAAERDNLAAWVVHEGGRIWPESLADVDEAVDHLAYNAQRLLALASTIEKHYSPRGVVAVISPWNFPVALPVGMLSGALAAGNSAILKSAEQTPIIATRLVDILHSSGIPDDVLVHLPGWGETGAHLVSSPGVDMIAFTGSKTVGLDIVRSASGAPVATAIKKVIVEMGGKNAIVVFPDADLDEAVRGILLSAFEHANQKCSACSRVFIHRAIFSRLRERLVMAAASLSVGPADEPGTLVNPLIEPEARERVLGYAGRAQSEGKVLVDRIEQKTGNPLQLGPMIVELAPENAASSTIAQEEIFGPVLALVPFEDEAWMLNQVNNTPYGLTAGIFSRSPATIARMVKGIRAGNIYINRKITGARVGIEPFGGFKLSGTGPKAGGPDYLMAFLTRRGEYGQSLPGASTTSSLAREDNMVTPWLVTAAERHDSLNRCLSLLQGRFRTDLERALEHSYSVSRSEAEALADQAIVAVSAVLRAVGEISAWEPTITLPGQRNYLSWETPRGRGFVIAADNTQCRLLTGMVFGPLLAGNGLVLAPSNGLRPVCQVLVKCLHRAGVPVTALAEATNDYPEAALFLARQMFHFAVTNLSLEQTQQVYQALGNTSEADEQHWVKALISMTDGPQPGEPGFIRQFAIPKTIAMRTLRHGADLEMPALEQ